MLRASDIMAGKILVQLGLADAQEVRADLRALDADPSPLRDVVNRLSDRGKVAAKDVELVRHRVALYGHVRSEATYMRLLERHRSIKKETVAELIASLERHAFRRRLGDVLVRKNLLTKEQDSVLASKARETTEGEDRKVVERYRAEDFAGVAKPLIPGSKLEPQDFKISALFRSKETRALVDQKELEALRRDAAAALREEVAPATHFPAVAPAPAPEAAPAPKREANKPTAPVRHKTGQFTGGIEAVKSLKRIDDYTLVEVLGVGGMGAVFLGQKDGRGEFAAVKVMLNQAASDAERGRFNREIKLTKKLEHKNVIGIIDSGETKDGLSYLVVPALAGKELRSLLDASAGQGLLPNLAFHIMEQVLEGLQAVHDKGIVHRDMKPENVFVLAGGKHDVKIMDFGLAKLDGESDSEVTGTYFQTMAGDIVGSPAYIAPESVQGDPIDGRTDIYSAGVMFFEMLTGKLPLESETPQGYLTQHMVCPPATLAEAQPNRKWIPEIEDLLARMLAKTRDERPKSCRAIIEELRGGLREKTVMAMAQVPELVETAAPINIARAEVAAAAAAPAAEAKAWGVKGLLGRLLGK